jgi:hypothetical protein
MVDREQYLYEMKSLFFGVELEMTGLRRSEAKRVLADFFKDEDLLDNAGRDWTIISDSSIVAKVNINGTLIPAPEEYKVELVSPILDIQIFLCFRSWLESYAKQEQLIQKKRVCMYMLVMIGIQWIH